MNGIDIARYQKGIDLGTVPCDFVIVKATQGTSYISPTFTQQIESAIRYGKKIGVYHYASKGGAEEEAKHFLSVVEPYIGKAILVLDWEGDQNPNFKNRDYALTFLRYVKEKTGVIPFIYMSKSVCRAYKWDASYPLWCAQYKNRNKTGYQTDPWTDNKGFGAWSSPVIFQYSSCGRLPGYNANLDLDKAYITPEQWDEYASGRETTPSYLLIKKGSRGETVKIAQTLLNNEGYALAVDGIFGPKTEEAVKDFQAKHIETCQMVDGIIGKRTWSALTRKG